jgi:hypothetical protein
MQQTRVGFWIVLVGIVLWTPRLLAGQDLSGEWKGGDWGKVVISGAKGTYTDTYQTGPGTFEFKQTGKNTYAGTWGESKQRFGTFSFKVSDDGKTIVGRYQADPNCAINPGSSDVLRWTRK